ncbi:hypothetical protein MBAV_006207 [Candidatus Magnetobacterium bavaricum]|uniref:Uncharacterized protein n=1 Tax=Candidatus Magnetobacterium bavaricum TaxID=29290 RepID=A0A0F3GLM5_9BACT|nr:hypothetical protein MBAV_006207 [Candidatus Magnetobacterium bavaricum]
MTLLRTTALPIRLLTASPSLQCCVSTLREHSLKLLLDRYLPIEKTFLNSYPFFILPKPCVPLPFSF